MTANQTKLLTCETYYYDVLTATPTANIYYLQGKITIKKHRYTMSIVTIIIDENSAQSAKLQQQHNKLYRKLMKADL
jgi:hypothetical protein